MPATSKVLLKIMTGSRISVVSWEKNNYKKNWAKRTMYIRHIDTKSILRDLRLFLSLFSISLVICSPKEVLIASYSFSIYL